MYKISQEHVIFIALQNVDVLFILYQAITDNKIQRKTVAKQ